MTLFLILHIVFSAVVIGFVFAIFYHYQEYAPSQDKLKWVTWIFMVAIFILIIVSIIYFFNIPWEKLIFYVQTAFGRKNY